MTSIYVREPIISCEKFTTELAEKYEAIPTTLDTAMPSRKKAQGKARKAAKAEVEASRCFHGFDQLSQSDRCKEFIKAFDLKYALTIAMGERMVGTTYTETWNAIQQEFPDALIDDAILKNASSHYLRIATDSVLQGRMVEPNTSHACFFEQIIAQCHEKSRPANMSKVLELMGTDQHTSVKFIRERIPCNCLDEKCKQVKSITKMGHCGNGNCISSTRDVERKTMVYCANCRRINNCCRECQVADWPRHKPLCKEASKMKAEFKASKR